MKIYGQVDILRLYSWIASLILGMIGLGLYLFFFHPLVLAIMFLVIALIVLIFAIVHCVEVWTR